MSNRDKNKQSQQKVEKDPLVPSKVKFESSSPINKWSSSTVKYSLDDTVKKIVKEELEYVENFQLMDQRLAICTIACSFSGFALVYDYLYPFPASRMVLAVCAISYFLMMCVLTVFTMYKEDNTIMVALEKDEAGVGPDNVWTYRTSLSKYSPLYTLKITYKDGQTGQTRSDTIESSVANWFDEDGKMQNETFFADVKSLHLKIQTKKEN